MNYSLSRAPVLIGASGAAMVLSLFLGACTSSGSEPAPTVSTTRPGSQAASTEPVAPTSSATAAAPGAGGEFVTGAPLPGSTGSDPVDEPDPSDYPASPLVTFATWNASAAQLEAGGVVSGQLDPAGTCRLVLVQGSNRVVRDSVPQASASSVDCGQFVVPRTELAAGSWSVTLRYVVGSSAASSEAVQVEVPA
jgi:hypothetical protein